MRIAIAQLPMAWTLAENTRAILEHLSRAKALGAEVALFPECATTGFHRQVPGQVSMDGIRDAIGRIRDACRALEMAAVVGTPFFPTDDESPRWNAAVVIGAEGEVRAVCPKVGPTPTERAYFDAGTERPTFTLGGISCGGLLCREVQDAEVARAAFGGVCVVFWPGVIAWNAPDTHPENVVTREMAADCARTLGAYLVQCNWANSLNDPELRGLGGSLVIAPDGEVVHECPADEPGITIVTLEVTDVVLSRAADGGLE